MRTVVKFYLTLLLKNVIMFMVKWCALAYQTAPRGYWRSFLVLFYLSKGCVSYINCCKEKGHYAIIHNALILM